jgi:hypothetical protein
MTEKKQLNEMLGKAACDGRVDEVMALLEQGADIDSRDYGGTDSTPLIHAAYRGHLKVVEFLLIKGADLQHSNQQGRTAEDYARERGHHKILELLHNPPTWNQTPEEIIFQRPLSNRTLEEVFNFVSLERISLIRNGKYGPVEAVVRESFSAIEDETTLRKAFEEHVKRGGKADEGVVFPNKLLKNKLPR